MKQVMTLMMITFIVFGLVFSSAFVLAQDNSTDNNETNNDTNQTNGDNNETNNDNNETNNDTNQTNGDNNETDEEEEDEERKVEVGHEFINEEGKRVKVRTKIIITEDGKTLTEYKIIVKGIEVNSKLEIKEIVDGNITRFIVKFRGDIEQALNFLPDDVAEIAREKLGSDDLNITLQEGIHKNVPKVLYQIETNKNGRFLGIFKLKMKIEGQIDPETGEFLGISKPWWAFLVTGEDEDQTGDDNNTNMTDTNMTDTNQTNGNETNSTT